ncbi:MAPK-interacting and spindle-stabilizing protein-like [Octopus bimaculoides]|nr:MAPK-interacting and spindle-stabilizing protein-like [Octopus bimaculoides]XP_014773327.1 MAPK-interacting and spindle-stabilizing protein-like [Octopus bimaculoides]XP_014773328.1 MAPK-interacting and spindle-stabilizing protein-like [Octopus bimaculoides]XP_029633554.1 MAPK-interacting and spindle-stabilizing protein-like [Octopus sinensis]XP_052827943.1 MAPK-interacting and spindle-stabilizing protein-like [Octopus bimaculoides]|eukprot:XP_014773326.1 PREDICTED: MAPK-interacting and spindle-stabilizing protein-like [Octopus bimaculoides]
MQQARGDDFAVHKSKQRNMSFYNSIPPSEKPGLYPAGTFPTASYAPSQPAGMPPAATPQQRFPSATQQYAMPAGAATPSLYTPSNGYTLMSPAYASSPAPGAFHSVGYSSLPSIPSTTPGYPTAQYPTTNFPPTQLPGSSAPYPGLPVSSQLYTGSGGYSPLQSVQPRAYTMPPMAYPSTLGTNPTYPGAPPFGPPY